MRHITYTIGVAAALIVTVFIWTHRSHTEEAAGAASLARNMHEANQLILVITPNWSSVEGQLQLYDRLSPDGAWRAVGSRVPVVVGPNGLAWGVGLHDIRAVAADTEPVKHEGDGKAPAGVFRLSSAFGYAPLDALPGLKLPYVQATSSLVCVDDSRSTKYNQLVNEETVTVDWNSAEEMRRQDDLYKWGVTVDHNANPITAGMGSCIFLHVWAGSGIPTTGCTAMPESTMREIVFWLDSKQRPLLVQLPQTLLNRFRTPWGLP